MKTSLGARTIVFPTPAYVIGTYNKEGRPNVSTVAWAGICCSRPPCIGVSLRKATYTYQNILEQRAFTVNVPSERYVVEVDYFGIASGRKEDKFAATGLTPVKSDSVSAPYIDEFPLVLECMLVSSAELGLHTQFIGEIIDVKVDESMLGEKGLPEVDRIEPIVYMPEVRAYYGVGRFLGRSFSIGRKFESS